jgi:polysaccharide pyruvyl transferase WcaK-like protein
VKWFVVWPGDLDITLYAAKTSGTSSEILPIYDDPQLYLHEVRSVSTFVGMKLHAVALATCAYVPSVMLEYRPKCRDYMTSIGCEDATIRTDSFCADRVWETVSSWDSRRCEASRALFDSISPIRKKQSAKAKEIQELLTNA